MIQTFIPAYRPLSSTEPLSNASIASREANPTVIEPSQTELSTKQKSAPTNASSEDSPVYDDPRKQAKPAAKQADDKNRELAEQLEVQSLSARDREVRAHERAHAAVGGQYASAPTYQYERGPDGINYAVAGEVKISTGAVAGDPQATIEKAQVIRRAALAPAEPSAQDRQVAAQASKMEMEALAELAVLQQEQRLQEQTIEKEDELAAPVPAEADHASDKNSNVSDDSSFRQNENRDAVDLPNHRLSALLDAQMMSEGNIAFDHTGTIIDLVA